jgi:hypothetical protein
VIDFSNERGRSLSSLLGPTLTGGIVTIENLLAHNVTRQIATMMNELRDIPNREPDGRWSSPAY